MNILINASDLKAGGGLQVADSICCELVNYPQHHFVVVLSSYLHSTKNRIADYKNVEVIEYDSPQYNIRLLLTGRDHFMDDLATRKSIQAVLSVFGPNIWVPECPHVSGFARSHLLIPESPYFTRMGFWERWKEKRFNNVLKYFFKRSSKVFYTENPYISKRLMKYLPGAIVHTITNNYNQVFDHPELCKEKKLPPFNGTSILCISAPYPHKNLAISIDIAKIWLESNPEFKFRFVFSIDKSDFPPLSPEMEPHFCLIGKVDISECPSLYEQCDITFQPSLLECFTATYPEAMRMNRPIVTTDMEFAKGLCEDAACYYSAVDAGAAADALYRVANDKVYSMQLVENGVKRLDSFDNYQERTKKLIALLEKIAE